MANKRIYLCLAHMSENGMEQKYIQEAFDTNWVVPLGPNVNGFEEDLKQFVGKDKELVANTLAYTNKVRFYRDISSGKIKSQNCPDLKFQSGPYT